MTYLYKRLFGLLLCLSYWQSFAQGPVASIRETFETYQRKTLQEKLFLHIDQSTHLTGETMWFKVYYVDANTNKPLTVSKVSYVEVLDKEMKPVLQTKIPLSANGGSGYLFLPASLGSGHYLVRAYTNWMKNFDAATFFEQPLTIINPFRPLGLPLKEAAPPFQVQLFPEGGNLVRGLTSKVAFRVADMADRGLPAQGWLLTAKNDTVARFATQQFGMGSFDVTPSGSETYRVVLLDKQGRTVTQPLPTISERGYVMRLDERNDQLLVSVRGNLPGSPMVYLLAHTRKDVKAAEARSVQQETTFLIDRKSLGEGVSHITLFDVDRKPVCERLYFKRPTKTLPIDVKTDQPQYAPRSKVTLTAAAADQSADLSMAVYRLDSLATGTSANIRNYCWLTSELQGNVETPDYYFQPETADTRAATDNLMLTHGWRRFQWSSILAGKSAPSAFTFVPEYNGLLVQGTLTNPASGAPVPNVITYLSVPSKLVRLYTSLSDSSGRVLFEMPDFYGSRSLIAQPEPKDSLLRLTITNPFSGKAPHDRLAEFALDESQAGGLLSRSVGMQAQTTYLGDRMLRYQNPSIDSTAFYRTPSESYLLDAYTRFPTTEDVLREYVLGVMVRKRQGHFHWIVPNVPYHEYFEKDPMVLLDGVPIFNIDKVMAFSPLKVRKLDVIKNRYMTGPATFDGLVSFMTYKGDLAGFPLDPHLIRMDYEGLQIQREFYAPRYDTPKQRNSRLPDGRTLLYWNPNLKTNTQGQIDFYTSDQDGTYLVEINGLAPDGRVGAQQLRFEVKQVIK
ncbi:hypothetical protein [Spirosoma pomorum]